MTDKLLDPPAFFKRAPMPENDTAASESALSDLLSANVKRRTDDGALAECALCGSLDIGGAHDTVNCYGCGLQITKAPPLQNAINAWNMRAGKSLDTAGT